MRTLALLALLSCSPLAASAEGRAAVVAPVSPEPARLDELSLSLGAGFSHELLGINLALRHSHLEGYLGLGLATLAPGASAGARIFAREDGRGFFLGLNGGFHLGDLQFDANGSTGGRIYWVTLTPGYRATFGSFFLEAALGGGYLGTLTFWDTPPSPTRGSSFLPDALLALGWRI